MENEYIADPHSFGDSSPFELLCWYEDLELIDFITENPLVWSGLEAPLSRFSSELKRPEKMPTLERENAQVPAPTPNALSQDILHTLSQIKTLEELTEFIGNFEGCPLKKTARNTVVWDGNPHAHVLVIGEAPGEQEDRYGKPFVGRSGNLLNKMLESIGLSRMETAPERSVLITNILFWRPPANRPPTDAEIILCAPFLNRLIEIVSPKAIMTMGGPATHHLLKSTLGIMKLRGKWNTYPLGTNSYPVLPTFHPAYLLRTPLAKRQAWHDLRMLQEFVRQSS